MTRFSKIRKDEYVTRKGRIIRKPKYDRCNKGHLLYFDTDRELWDCPICLKKQQEEADVECPRCGTNMIKQESSFDTYNRGTEVHSTIDSEYLLCPKCGYEIDEMED